MFGEEIETLRDQMRQVALREEALLRSLAESINAVEDKLLQHVREIAAEHGTRRTQLLDELRGLSERIGTFPGNAPQLAGALPNASFNFVTPEPFSQVGGDWRHATRAIESDEGFDEMLQTGTG